MKKFKQTDLWINVVLISSLSLAAIAGLIDLFSCYYIVGGWQCISMIVHGFTGWFMQKGGRRIGFHYTVITIGLIVILSNWFQPFLVIFLLLLLGAPAMAIIYTMMCFDECQEMKERPLSKLK